jgi:hypothetical protein
VDFIATNFPTAAADNGCFLTWTPVPEFFTGWNAMIHEYCFVKSQSRTDKFPDLDLQDYFGLLRRELNRFSDPELKAQYLELLTSKGFSEPAFQATPSARSFSGLASPSQKTIARRFKDVLASKPTWSFWWFLFQHLGVRMPWGLLDRFPAIENAIAYCNYMQTRPTVNDITHLYEGHDPPLRSLGPAL